MNRRRLIIDGIAGSAGAIVLLPIFDFARQTRHEFDDLVLKANAHLHAEKAAGRLPPEFANQDIDSISADRFGMMLPDNLK
jgi:hypothetical protein